MGGEHWAWLSCDENGEIDEGRAARIDASIEGEGKKKKRGERVHDVSMESK